MTLTSLLWLVFTFRGAMVIFLGRIRLSVRVRVRDRTLMFAIGPITMIGQL